MKRTTQTSFLPPALLLGALIQCAWFRVAMRVTQLMVFPSFLSGETGYYLCPRCRITMEREFMAFCDRCGQRLDWSGCKTAEIIYPKSRSGAHR